jgi:hypothetical protein
MKVKDLRGWINSLPKGKDEHRIVFRNIKPIEDSENLIAEDYPIVASGIDDGNKEAFLCGQDSYKLMVDFHEEINN